MLDTLILIAGLVLVTIGADRLTEGASAIAKRLGVTEFMVGMTIVAVGTSLPELVVSITAAIGGSADLSIGNVVGSNICNILLILGITSLIVPVPLTRDNIRKDIPMTLGVSVLFTLMALDAYITGGENVISRLDGAVFCILYAAFILYLIRTSKEVSDSSQDSRPMGFARASVYVVLGLAALIVGAKLFVNGATGIATALGISEAVIGITVVAIGTSLPELAASLTAAVKGKSSMAIGNILGSNIANILLIMGTSSVISPLHLKDINITDFGVMLLAPLLMLLYPLIIRKKEIIRLEGALFLAVYIVYTVSLVM